MGKIKSIFESEKGKDILVVLVIILVGLGSFELGRLSKTNSSTGLKIEYVGENGQIQAANVLSGQMVINSANNVQKSFFASSRGTKYYSLNCSGGNNIKQENRIYFSTREEAEAAGYSLSSTCY